MKKIFALVLCALMLFSLTACKITTSNNENVTDPPKDVTEAPENSESTKPEPDEKAEEKVTYIAEYEDVLTESYEFIVNIEKKVGPDDGFYGIWNAALALGDKALEEIGYVFKDINGDGIYELMIGSFDKMEGAYTNNEIYALYTLIDESPKLLLDGWNRSMYSLKEDGSFFYQGSSGAAYSIFGTYYMDENNEIVCKDYYFTSPDVIDPSVIGIYHNETGIFYEDMSEKLDITLDDFWLLEEDAAEGTVKLSATPFSELDEELVAKALEVKPAPDASLIVGKWVMVSGETDGYEYSAEEEGITSEILITESPDGTLKAEYSIKYEYGEPRFLEADLVLRDEPLYIGCGNDEWSMQLNVNSGNFDEQDEFYVALIEEDKLLLRNIFPFDGSLGVSHQTFERE